MITTSLGVGITRCRGLLFSAPRATRSYSSSPVVRFSGVHPAVRRCCSNKSADSTSAEAQVFGHKTSYISSTALLHAAPATSAAAGRGTAVFAPRSGPHITAAAQQRLRSFSPRMKSAFGGALRGFARRRITPPSSPRASWARAYAYQEDDFASGRSGGGGGGGAESNNAAPDAFGTHDQQQQGAAFRNQQTEQDEQTREQQSGYSDGNGTSSRAFVTAAADAAEATVLWRGEKKGDQPGRVGAQDYSAGSGPFVPSPREPLLPSPRKQPAAGTLLSLSKYYLAFLVVGASANSFGAPQRRHSIRSWC